MEKAERRVILPAAFILDLDDVMWHHAAEERMYPVLPMNIGTLRHATSLT